MPESMVKEAKRAIAAQ